MPHLAHLNAMISAPKVAFTDWIFHGSWISHPVITCGHTKGCPHASLCLLVPSRCGIGMG